MDSGRPPGSPEWLWRLKGATRSPIDLCVRDVDQWTGTEESIRVEGTPMTAHVVFHDDLGVAMPAQERGTATCLVDLGFPCHLACVACDREEPSPALYHMARRQLCGIARADAVESLRTVFFGGDVFFLPRAFEALLEEVGEICREGGRSFRAAALSDGSCWRTDVSRRLVALGVHGVQVTLDGPPAVHDRRRPSKCGLGSFDRIIGSMQDHREQLRVIVRTHAERDDDSVSAIAEELDRAGLFSGSNPVLLYVAPLAPYREQARDLLRLLLLPSDERAEASPRVSPDPHP